MSRFHTISQPGALGQIDIPFTPEEERLRDLEEAANSRETELANKQSIGRENAKKRALAKLSALGLTPEECRALIPG